MANDFVYLCFYVIYFKLYICSNFNGWNYININCRDNNNAPTDWWYLFKPPNDAEFFSNGRNFTYVTPETSGRWQRSNKYITSNSMLQHTLSPIFRRTFALSLAFVIYENGENADGSTNSLSRGILMASEMGGIWLKHTIPDLIKLKDNRFSFPTEENEFGHLAMCLSIDLDGVNMIANQVKLMSPRIVRVKIPSSLKHLLPQWDFETAPRPGSKNIQLYKFHTKDYLQVEVLAKPPGNKICLYTAFAKSKKVYLDVYGQTEDRELAAICGTSFGLRSIDSISLKYQDEVYYIKEKNNYMRFAVSATIAGQKQGPDGRQYWVCISSMDRDDSSGVGGDLTCVNDYKVWITFDILKVKDPEC